MRTLPFVDDFRDWTGDLRLADGRTVTAIGLRGDVLTAIVAGQVGNQIGMSFDRETGTALGGEQIHPEEMYRVRPETYLRRGAGKAAYMAYAATVGVSFSYDQIPPDRRQLWGEAMMGVGVYAGRMLYDEFCDLHCGNLQGHKFLHWSALRADERAGWDAAVLAGGEHLATYRKQVPAATRAGRDLPQPGEVVRVLNALLGVKGVDRRWSPIVSPVCMTGLMVAMNRMWPEVAEDRGAIMAIVEGGVIQRFDLTANGDFAEGGVVPGTYGKPALVMCGGDYPNAHQPTIPVTIKTPTAADFSELVTRPAPCLDPEKMNGYADQFPGTDDPSPDAFPNPR